MKFKKTTLKNGLRVITVPMKDNPTVTVLVLVSTGSKYESKEINGISHFLEHMCFKGTEKRPTAFAITEELDGIGAHSNAFTGHEYTGYYAKADAKHFAKILDVLADVYLNPKLDEKEIEKEKGVISDEIAMYEDQPKRRVQELFMELLYGNQPAGWDITGDKKTIRKFKRDDFVRYRSRHYVARGTLVVVSGNIKEKEAIALVEKKFSGASSAKKHGKAAVSEKQSSPRVAISKKATDQTHLVLGVRTFDTYSKNNPVMAVLSGILSAGMSSRLFQKIRNEMGVGYYINANNDTYTDHGFLEVSTGVDSRRVEEVISAILGEFKRLKNEKVPATELKKVKDYLIGTMFLGLESSDSLAEFYGMQEILKKPIMKPDDIVKKINAVTADDVRRLAKNIFKNKSLNLAMIGPFGDSGRFAKLLKF